MWQRSYDGSSTLYLIPTPIGNMDDVTFRTINILKDVEVVFSEDTRVTANLLNHFDIKKKLISLHEHNEDLVKDKVLKYLSDGKNVGLVTDRGTPIISDPGYKTVKYVSDLGYNVVALPGANAFVPALIVSGLPPQPFTFYGFLDSRDSKKRKELKSLVNVANTMIFYEAPHRIVKTLKMMLEILGDRNISLSREISKKFESVYRGKISGILNDSENMRGEFVIVVSGCHLKMQKYDDDYIIELVNNYIDNGFSATDSIKVVASELKLKKNDVYNLYHKGSDRK